MRFPKLLTKFHKYRFLLLVVILSIPSILSLLRPGYFPMHDDMQAMRIRQLDECVKSFQIPCRWVPNMGYGYGYPQFNYYGPLPYYVGELAHLSGMSFLDAVKFTFILALLLGNLSMYLLGRKLWGEYGGVLSSVLYAYAPYRAGDIFSRGAMGETWGFVFLPLIIWSLIRLIDRPNLKNSALLSLSYAGLFLTHNISSLIFAPLAGLFAVVYYLKPQRVSIKKLIPYLILSAIWSVSIAATFFLPVIFEKQYAHVETMLMGYFNYLAHFVTIKQLFLSTFWAYGSSELGPNDDLSFFVGPLHLLIAFVVFVLVFFRDLKSLVVSRRISHTSFIVYSCLACFFIAVFFTHSKSSFIWERVTLLHYLQFPWRFLSPASFFISLVGGYYLTKTNGLSLKLLITICLLVILSAAAFFYPKSYYAITDREKFSGYLYDRQLTISIYDYLPIYASHPPVTVAPSFPQIISGRADVYQYQKQSDQLKFKVRADSESKIMVNQFDFPGMKVMVANQAVTSHHDNELGLISFTLPSGDHDITVKLTNTPIRTLGNLLTILGGLSAILVLRKKDA